jgi:hypothetical protein
LRLLDSTAWVYVKLYSFSDNDLLTVQLWERMLHHAERCTGVTGLIIDMRQNGGGSGFARRPDGGVLLLRRAARTWQDRLL